MRAQYLILFAFYLTCATLFYFSGPCLFLLHTEWAVVGTGNFCEATVKGEQYSSKFVYLHRTALLVLRAVYLWCAQQSKLTEPSFVERYKGQDQRISVTQTSNGVVYNIVGTALRS